MRAPAHRLAVLEFLVVVHARVFEFALCLHARARAVILFAWVCGIFKAFVRASIVFV